MFRKTSAAILIAALGFMPLAASAQEGGGTTLKTTNGAWEIRCSEAQPENCVMSQVGNRADGKAVLRVALRKTPGAKGPKGEAIAAVIQIDAPLGVLLPAGVEVTIDGTPIGRAGFQVCDGRACIASEPVPADFVNKMKAGSKAVMTVLAVNGEKASIDISLNGFTKSFDSL